MAGATISQNIQPTQRAVIQYNVNAPISNDMRNKTSFVTLGRELTNSGASSAAAAGSIVAAYVNCSVFVNSGTYHNFLYGTASGSPAFTQYGSGGTEYGRPIDYTIISDAALVAKYDATIRKIKTDFPFINAFFLDDCGPDWSGYIPLGGSVRETFYQKHVAIAKKMRALGNALNVLMMTNGEWRKDTNFGYPVRGQWGCDQYDGFCIEHHAANQLSFWLGVGDGQWRLRDPQGQRCMFFIANNASETSAYRNQRNIAWLGQQTTPQYTSNPPPILTQLPTHDLGLSFGAAPPTITVSVTPTSADLLTGTTQQFTMTASNGASITTRQVNGITGGNATVGTINGSSLYTAPAAVPAGGVVTVTGAIATGQSGSATVRMTTTAPPPADTQLPAPPAPAPNAFGNRFAATIPNKMTPDYVRGCRVTAPEDGTAVSITFGFDGANGGIAPQPVTPRVFATDSAGNGAALVQSAAEQTIFLNDPAQWVTRTLAATFDFLAGDSFYLALHTGGTEATGRFFRNVNPSVSRAVDDTYLGGSIASLAGATVGDADISIYLNYTKASVTGVALGLPQTGEGIHKVNITSGGGLSVPVQYIAVKTRLVSRLVPEPYFVDSRDDSEALESSPGVFTPK